MPAWKTEIVNLWKRCGQFILFALAFSKDHKAIWILNFGVIYQRNLPQLKPVIPDPEPIHMHEQVVIKGNIFMVSYINEGKRRISLQYLGNLREELKRHE